MSWHCNQKHSTAQHKTLQLLRAGLEGAQQTRLTRLEIVCSRTTQWSSVPSAAAGPCNQEVVPQASHQALQSTHRQTCCLGQGVEAALLGGAQVVKVTRQLGVPWGLGGWRGVNGATEEHGEGRAART